jgi:L-histidine Nalpha-methyltransferase
VILRSPAQIPDYTWEVTTGLTTRPRRLPCKLFYDERGSSLFEEITRLPEYYLTRTELQILQQNAINIVLAVGSPVSMVELGAGTAAKTMTLLHAASRRQMRLKYFPVDISPSALNEARRRVRSKFSGALVRAVVTDFEHGFRFLREIPERRLVLYLGSSIGNFEHDEAIALLKRVRENLCPGDVLLLGTDMAKSPKILIPAYDDPAGVTAEFNKNVLLRINRELGANFDLGGFRHVAEWNPVRSRIEIYLESQRPQTVRIRATNAAVHFVAGERIHTENSHKYSRDGIERMLCVSGFKLEKSWFDPRKWFGLHLARA